MKMSSYFDNFDREVSEMSRAKPDTDAFLRDLEAMEACLARDCELFAGDIETPQDVRECIMAVIALGSVEHNPQAREFAASVRTSKLSQDMHSLFHDIARMRYSMRYGPVFDNPRAAVERRDLDVEERDKNKLPHPWQSNPPSDKPALVLRDAPSYCRKAIARLAEAHSHAQDRELKRQDRLFEIERAKLDYIDGIAEGQE
jgi:hypothetical protein